MAVCNQPLNNFSSHRCTLEEGHVRPHHHNPTPMSTPENPSYDRPEPKPKDPYQSVIDRINAMEAPKSQRQGKVPDAVMEAISAARARGFSYKRIYEQIGEEWYTTADSFASSHRHWLRKKGQA